MSMNLPLCKEKKRYGSSHEVLGVLRVRQREIDYPLYAYRCQDPKCAGFHLTRVKPPDNVRLHVPELAPARARVAALIAQATIAGAQDALDVLE